MAQNNSEYKSGSEFEICDESEYESGSESDSEEAEEKLARERCVNNVNIRDFDRLICEYWIEKVNSNYADYVRSKIIEKPGNGRTDFSSDSDSDYE